MKVTSRTAIFCLHVSFTLTLTGGNLIYDIYHTEKQCIKHHRNSQEYETDKCTSNRDFHANMKQIMDRSKCGMPRETMVHIRPNITGAEFIPNVVPVARCTGFCAPGQACQPSPSHSSIKRIPVRLLTPGGKATQCVHALVKQHVMCMCGCRLQPDDCNELQEYRPKTCECECTHGRMAEKSVCERLQNRQWNMAECRCECRSQSACTTGSYWVPDLCRCMKMVE